MLIFPHRSFTHLLLSELSAVAENFRTLWKIMSYRLIFVFVIFTPYFSKGACPYPKTTLKNPADPLDFYYCHPNSAGHECPAGATCDNLWLGLFVCCAINDTMKDDPGLHDDFDEAFSDSEPSDRHMKNRKNFAIFLPAQNSQTSQDEGNSTVENGSNSQSSESNIYTRGFIGGSTIGHTSFDTRFTDDATNFQSSTDVNPTNDLLAGNTTGLKDSLGSKDNKSSSASFAHIFILQEGTNQRVNVNTYKFPATVTLIKDSGKSVIVDTGLPTDYNLLELFLSEISRYGVEADTVDVVVTTHGHPDHFGHLNLFPSAVQYFGGLMYYGTTFSMSELYNSEIAKISERVTVVKTPGHTAEDLSVLVKNVTQLGTVAVVGDLFISKDDIENPEVWETQAWNSTIQHQHRKMILCSSDYIVPGHGAMFKVEKHMRKLFECKGRTL